MSLLLVSLMKTCGIDYPDRYQFCPSWSPLKLVVAKFTKSAPPQGNPDSRPSNKKFDLKVLGSILGTVIAVALIVVLILGLSSSTVSLAQFSSVAQKYYGGTWSVDNSNSGVAVYVGNGKYNVTLLDGTKKTMSYYELMTYMDILSSSYTGGFYFQPNYEGLYPSKVVFVTTKGNVNGKEALILGVGAYYSTKPNMAENQYKALNSSLSHYAQMSEYMKNYGVEFKMGSHDGYIYSFISTTNEKMLPNPSLVNHVTRLGFTNVTALSSYTEVSQSEQIAIVIVNVVPNISQAQEFASIIAKQLH